MGSIVEVASCDITECDPIDIPATEWRIVAADSVVTADGEIPLVDHLTPGRMRMRFPSFAPNNLSANRRQPNTNCGVGSTKIASNNHHSCARQAGAVARGFLQNTTNPDVA
jgi:hypothetical protein